MTLETNSPQKITPYLWFDGNAEEAATLYVSAFTAAGAGEARIGQVTRYGAATEEVSGQPAGAVMTVAFTLAGLTFVGLNGGPQYQFTPAVSFFVNCATEAELDALWWKIGDRGTVLMPLDQYPFAEKFGWLNDRFGVSWQFALAPAAQKITPYLLFVGEQAGRAEEAIHFYTSLFADARVDLVQHFGPDMGEPEGNVMHAEYTLAGQPFIAMDSAADHKFGFSEANSFLVSCADQAEVDFFWERLTDGGEEGPCGWLKDRYGVSWQIVPTALPEMLGDEDPAKAQRVTEAMLQMGKIEIDELRRAYVGSGVR